ncbi:MAG: TonB-system energizer ExbB [Deferribacterales bacterium]
MNMLTHLVDYGIIGILTLLSIIAVAISIERFSFYKKIDTGSYITVQELESALTSRLHLVAIIGSNAPYIGLLGTVLGIMQTFYSMGNNGTTNVNDIMAGLALALKATAAGLLVAIPSIVLYNILHRRVNVLILKREAENERQKL